MAVKIKLKRLGKTRAPYYRIIVIDAKAKRDGRAIEEIGKYAPKEDPSFIEVNSERVQHWLSVGAQPTEPVQAILRKTGDWQLFKGQTPPDPLMVPETKPDKKTVFEAASKEALAEADESVQPAKGKKSGQKTSGGGKAADTKAAERTEETPEEQPAEQAEAKAPAESEAETSAAQSEG